MRESEQLWSGLEELVRVRGIPERAIGVLFDAAQGLRVRNATHRATDPGELSDATAGRDLKAMVDKGLLVPHGERRGRYYTATAELAALWDLAREDRGPGVGLSD